MTLVVCINPAEESAYRYRVVVGVMEAEWYWQINRPKNFVDYC